MRDKTTTGPLQWVSLDGRTKDFWCDLDDGRTIRMTFLALVDVASCAVLGWELATSENARSTQRLIRKVCAQSGIFDNIYPDNGPAFAGQLVAGGTEKKSLRGKAWALEAVIPLGICHHLGIEMTFATPGNGQAKYAERAFAVMSRRIDGRPEFAGAHAGHEPGAAPGPNIKPVPLALAMQVLEREVARHNALAGRRGQGMRGRSCHTNRRSC